MVSIRFLFTSQKKKDEAFENAFIHLNESITLSIDKINYLQWCLDTKTVPSLTGDGFQKNWNETLDNEFNNILRQNDSKYMAILGGAKNNARNLNNNYSRDILGDFIEKDIISDLSEKETSRKSIESMSSSACAIDPIFIQAQKVKKRRCFSARMNIRIKLKSEYDNKRILNFYCVILDEKNNIIDERDTSSGYIFLGHKKLRNASSLIVGSENFYKRKIILDYVYPKFKSRTICENEKTVLSIRSSSFKNKYSRTRNVEAFLFSVDEPIPSDVSF